MRLDSVVRPVEGVQPGGRSSTTEEASESRDIFLHTAIAFLNSETFS